MTHYKPRPVPPVMWGRLELRAPYRGRGGYIEARAPFGPWRIKVWGVQVYAVERKLDVLSSALSGRRIIRQNHVDSLILEGDCLTVTDSHFQSYRLELTTRKVEPLGELFCAPSAEDYRRYCAAFHYLEGQGLARSQGSYWVLEHTTVRPWADEILHRPARRARLEDRFPASPTVRLVEPSLEAFANEEGFVRFLEEHPGARGRVRVSRVLELEDGSARFQVESIEKPGGWHVQILQTRECQVVSAKYLEGPARAAERRI